jgi:hypothetical protein
MKKNYFLIFILLFCYSCNNEINSPIVNKKYYDYFPIEVGYEWIFEYTEDGSYERNGTCIWSVINKTNKNDSLIFYLMEEISDTTNDTSIISYFTINQSLINDSIKVSGGQIFDIFSRYYPLDSDMELFKYFTYYGASITYYLKREVGLTSYDYHKQINSWLYYWKKYDLIAFNKKKT